MSFKNQNLTENDVKVLFEMGNASKILKEKIKSKKFKTDLEIYLSIKKYCKENNWVFAFPPLISVDEVVSHWAIDPKKPQKLDKGRIYSIDFGFKDIKTKVITDCSTTVCNDISLKKYVDIYDEIKEEILNDLNQFYLKKNFLTIEYITYLMDSKILKYRVLFQTISFAGSHTILKNQLHGEVIPPVQIGRLPNEALPEYEFKQSHIKLKRNTVFTVEPHVKILECSNNISNETNLKNKIIKTNSKNLAIKKVKKYTAYPSNIVYIKPLKIYMLEKEALNLGYSPKDLNKESYIVTPEMNFYNEDTYFLADFEVKKVT